MLGLCLLLILLWLILVSLATQLSMESLNQDHIQPLAARAYGYGYGAVPASYSVVPEPVLILAALAFVAFLIQIVQALFVGNQQPSTSLVGGLVDSLVPTRHRTLEEEDERYYKRVSDAIKFMKLMEKTKKKELEPEWLDSVKKSSRDSPDGENLYGPFATTEPTILVAVAKNPMRKR